MSSKIKPREKYRVKDIVADIKKFDPIPSVTYRIGSDLIYSELTWSRSVRGPDDPVTIHLDEFLKFLQYDFERQLVEGELYRTTDTPKAAFNKFLKDKAPEFVLYPLTRPPEFIHSVLKSAVEMLKKERKKFKKMMKIAKADVKANPESPDSWYRLRLLLWMVGKYKDASEAFQKAKKLGWSPTNSPVVAV